MMHRCSHLARRATPAAHARGLLAVVSVLIVAGSVLVGCGGGGGSSAKSVQVRLVEFQLTPNAADTKSGKTEFDVRNMGTTQHEMVMVRADSIDQLPKKPDGSIDEDQIPEASKVGETGEFTANSTKHLTFNLKAGNYVLFCNIVQNTAAGPVSHFARGMHAQISVT